MGRREKYAGIIIAGTFVDQARKVFVGARLSRHHPRHSLGVPLVHYKGKGAPAALFMALFRTVVRVFCASSTSSSSSTSRSGW